MGKKMETFISHLQPAEYYPAIINGLKKRTPAPDSGEMPNAIWLKNLVPAIRQEAEALITTPKEEKEAILTQLQKEVDDLILTASYYHLKKTHAESPVIMLKLLNQGDSTDPLFGFMTTKKKESLVFLPTVTRQSLYKGGAMCLFPDHKS